MKPKKEKTTRTPDVDMMIKINKVMDMKDQGMSYEEIAKEMNVVMSTAIKYHRKGYMLQKREKDQEVSTLKLRNPKKWPEQLQKLIGMQMQNLEEKMKIERLGGSSAQQATTLAILIDKYRLLHGQSTENIFNVSIKANMSSNDMMKQLVSYREKNVQNSDRREKEKK